MDNIAALREEYARARLNEEDAAADPLLQFGKWFDEALLAEVPLPNAMTLATAGAAATPSARIVLLKGFDEGGFVFFTSYESRKGLELAENERAALVFFWPQLERQIRIEGSVARVGEVESDEYYASRPLGARLGAWASTQSKVLPNRAYLEARLAEASRLHGDHPSRPPSWGGYRLAPAMIEFWQGRPDRLHDRLRYRRASGAWTLERLAP